MLFADPSAPGRTLVMGVVNVTPDSFSDGGLFLSFDNALTQAIRLADEGADILDIGGESSRPGSDPTPEAEELDRVAPLIEKLRSEVDLPLSIDTYKPRVARECLRLGARIVNDITGLADPDMIPAAAEARAGVVIMHMRGRPKTMQQDVSYQDVVGEVRDFLADRAAAAEAAGITDIAVDPGIGFGKSAEQNFELLRRLREMAAIGRPILIGPSRKSFLGALPSRLPVEDRLEGTIAACCAGVMNGASIVRVHDVAACKRALEVIDAIHTPWTRS